MKIASENWHYSLPFMIIIIALTLLTLTIILISAIQMKFPYTTDMLWLMTLHDNIALLLVPAGALLLVAVRPFINDYMIIFLIVMIGLSLFSVAMLGKFLFTDIDPPLYLVAHIVITLAGLSFLILANGYTKKTLQQ